MANEKLSGIAAQPALEQTLSGTTAFYVANATTGGWTTLGDITTYLQNLIGAAITLQGDWDASINDPDITGTTTAGYAWRVSNTGSTNLGGITDWAVGDLAVKTATGWLKVDNSDISAVWGNISGTLSNQTDLQNALNAKAASIHAAQHTDGTDDIQSATNVLKGLLTATQQTIGGRKDFNTPPRFETLNTGDELIKTDSNGDTQESGVKADVAPAGGSGITFVIYSSAPVNPPAGFTWFQTKDANTVTFNFFDGTKTYTTDLAK